MTEQELLTYIRSRLSQGGGSGAFIDTKFWLDDLEQRFPHIPREAAHKHLRDEAAKVGVAAP